MKELKSKEQFMITKERIGDELYIYHNGELVYKKWFKPNSTEKAQPSALFQIKPRWTDYIK